MARYRYDGNRSPVDYTSALHITTGVTIGLHEDTEIPAGELQELRKFYILTKVKDDLVQQNPSDAGNSYPKLINPERGD